MDNRELLYYSLDHELTAAQQQQLEQALEQSAELRTEQTQLLQMSQWLIQAQAPQNDLFSQKVLIAIEAQSVNTIGATIIQLFPKVAAACAIVASTALLNIYWTEGTLSQEAIFGVQDLAPEDAYSYIDLSE